MRKNFYGMGMLFVLLMLIWCDVHSNPYRQYTWHHLARNPIVFFSAVDVNTARLANQTYFPGATTSQNQKLHYY